MFKYIVWAIIGYLFIRFVFNFVLPLFRATKQMRHQMKQFREKMEEQQQFRSGNTATSPSGRDKPASRPRTDDYLDFEEIK